MIPLSEYPRPTLRRESYLNLNGLWQYAIRGNEETPADYDGEILVPYSPEAPMSGVNRQLMPGQWLHYSRGFTPPPGDGGRVLLHFGAVDHEAKVFVNRRPVGGHRGGYLPFTLDVTDTLTKGENLLQVAVADPSDTGHQARGKQKLKASGMFYTAQSGIWQTVWMERVPENHIRRLKITPLFEKNAALIEVDAAEPRGAEITVSAEDREIVRTVCGADGRAEAVIPAEHLRHWSPEDPFLYDLTVRLPDGDEAESYFALRKFSVERDCRGLLRHFLNGKPYFLNGLLDQGYWPEGLYTPPADEAMVHDIQSAKALGFNLLRKHIKIEPERWYYHCDRLGMVVWQDMVNGGGAYPSWFLTYAINLLPGLLRFWPDRNYRFFGRGNGSERERYYEELAGMVELLCNHPSIGAWVPFNEGWGQFDAPKATKLVRELDSTRLIDEASGWFDQRGGDFYSIHSYFLPLYVRPKKERVVALTEYGGVTWACPGHTTGHKTYGYGGAKSREGLAEKFRRLQMDTVLPKIKRGLSVLVYTQLSDVEGEINGLLTYDRKVVKLDEETALACAAKLMEEFRRCTTE